MSNSFTEALNPRITLTSTYFDNAWLGEYIPDFIYNQIKMLLICGMFNSCHFPTILYNTISLATNQKHFDLIVNKVSNIFTY